MKNKISFFGVAVVAFMLIASPMLSHAQKPDPTQPVFQATVQPAPPVGQQVIKAIWKAIEDLQNLVGSIQLTPGPKGDKGDPGAEIRLSDANNQDLGLLISTSSPTEDPTYTVFHEGSDLFFKFKTDTDIQDVQVYEGVNDGKRPYFDQLNCQGNAMIEDNTVAPQAHSRMDSVPPRYFKRSNDTGAVRTALSRADGPNCMNLPNQTTQTYFLIEEFIPHFTEPLTWPLEVSAN